MKPFLQYLLEAGQAAGSLEVATLPLPHARAYAEAQFQKHQHLSLDAALPHFNQSYTTAQALAQLGFAKRAEMPVIDEKDVHDLQWRLMGGFLDISEPHAKENAANPFPQGIDGDRAQRWLKDGLPQFDGGKPGDDRIKCSLTTVAAGKLKPIQKQIYFDKCIDASAKSGTAKATAFLKGATLVASTDHFIIDGHHRWMSANLIDPAMELKVLQVDLPIRTLLPLTLTYSDAIGNKRNA